MAGQSQDRRGIRRGLLGALATTLAQHAIGYRPGIVDYDRWIELGLRFGLGAMAGDSVKSFFKRVFWEPAHFVMERKMMLTIKRSAESVAA